MGLYFNLLTSSVAPLAFFSLHAALQDNARKLLSEYVPLKQDVNRMRTDLLDLEKLPEITDEERTPEVLAALSRSPCAETCRNAK